MYYNAKEYNLAIPEFQKAIEKEPANAELYFYLGMCCKEEHNTGAVEAFQKAIDLKPDYIDAHVNLGVVYINLSMYQKAAEVLREAVKLDPNYAEALLKLGLAYAMAKEFRAAVNVLKKAADINMDARAYYALGMSYVGLNMFSEGIKALDSSLDLDPELLESYVALGYALIGVKNWSRGIKVMNRAVVLDPQNPHVRYLLGFMYLGLKNFDAAERQQQILSQITDKDASKLSADLGNAISRFKR
ncbi:MAG: tetratricopeptide repeat protein [Candidatus Aminicenantes bacterium]|nr:tetratricopeptide repeat protein [Candidatus Aminicenantes bacterium]